MQRWLRANTLRTLHRAGAFDRLRDSGWRQRRLLILCYHSFAIEEENKWRPSLYLSADRLEQRLELLKQTGANVIGLGEGIERLQRGDLPPCSVVLTFDDGTYDFYKLAYPLLKKYGFPATVYQTTFYCDRALPVFGVMCSYLLWKGRDQILQPNTKIGVPEAVLLGTLQSRQQALNLIVKYAEMHQLSTAQKNEIAAELAQSLGIDYQALLNKRVMQLMNPQEISELAAAGIDFQLHTHRHRTPRDQKRFEREIDDNLAALQSMTKARPTHFCYPSGDYDMMFLPWLEKKGVVSATTCDGGLASQRSHPLLLPRFIDTTIRTPLEFESWVTGVGMITSAQVGKAWLRTMVGLQPR